MGGNPFPVAGDPNPPVATIPAVAAVIARIADRNDRPYARIGVAVVAIAIAAVATVTIAVPIAVAVSVAIAVRVILAIPVPAAPPVAGIGGGRERKPGCRGKAKGNQLFHRNTPPPKWSG